MQTWRKALLFLMSFGLIFAGYVEIQNLTSHLSGSEVMTKLDNAIPFIPEFVWFYTGGFVVVLAVAFLEDRVFNKFLGSFIVSSLICLFIFYMYPNEYVSRPLLVGDNYTNTLLGLVYKYDGPNNTLPSLHVLYAMLVASAFKHDRTKPWFVEMLVWIVCLLVAISTLFVKQHCIVDVLASVAIAFFSNHIVYRRNELGT